MGYIRLRREYCRIEIVSFENDFMFYSNLVLGQLITTEAYSQHTKTNHVFKFNVCKF